MTAPAPAATLVIFGAQGDLSRRLLAPALLNLHQRALLDDGFRVIGVGRRESDDGQFRDMLREFVDEEADWTRFAERLQFLRGDFDDPALFDALKQRLTGNAAFYFAADPAFFAPLVDKLADAGLLDEADGFRRIAIEKPFGHDLASARTLNERIVAQMGEGQVYRVDHFLGKETVQNILVARFANALAEAVWDARRIDHVQITAAETVTVGGRGKFYDATGALRDMVPNHLFTLLALVAMEPPASLAPEDIRDAKAALLGAVRAARPEDSVRGQYRVGEAGGEPVKDYRAETDVAPGSRTETFVALKLAVDTPRWRSVPFYLRTGKALAARDSEIVIAFRPPETPLFANATAQALARLVIQLQPEEGISLGLKVKRPGIEIETTTVALAFGYRDYFKLGGATGYETLFYDLLTGDQTLFQRADMIEAGWAAVQPLIDAWTEGEPIDYLAGSDGPDAAHDLMARDGRAWHALGRNEGVDR